MKSRTLLLTLALLLAGCTAISLQNPGAAKVGVLTVEPTVAWNVLGPDMAPFARAGAQVWTLDGALLDRLMIIPGVPEGEPIFKEPSKATVLPRFRADMLPDELAQLTESSIGKLLGEGSTVVNTAGMRPARFGGQRGIMFDLSATLTDGPRYRGVAGAFVVDGRLNMVMYLAADPYYFDKNRAAAEAVISSAHL